MEAAIVEQLKEYGRTHFEADRERLPQHVGDLVSTYPFAFLIGAAFDRGIPWKKAWEIPYHIAQRDMLDPYKIAKAADSELDALLKDLPVKPRYTNDWTRTLRGAAKLAIEFGGDANGIWKDTSPRTAVSRLRRIHGVGPGIAAMAVRLLHDDYGFFQGQEHEIDVKADVHVKRVFKRTGLTPTESESNAINVARRLSPAFPGELDWPAWNIGEHWCHSYGPACSTCPLTQVCPKLI